MDFSSSPRQLNAALASLSAQNIKVSEVLLFLLLNPEEINAVFNNAVNDLLIYHEEILNAFRSHPTFANNTQKWIHGCVTEDLSAEIKDLTNASTGWHGYARSSTVQQYESISAPQLIGTARRVAPKLWALFNHLYTINRHSDHGDDSIRHINESSVDAMDLDIDDHPQMSAPDHTMNINELV